MGVFDYDHVYGDYEWIFKTSKYDELNKAIIFKRIEQVKDYLNDDKLILNDEQIKHLLKSALLYYNEDIFDTLITDKHFNCVDIKDIILLVCRLIEDKNTISKIFSKTNDLSFNDNEPIIVASKHQNYNVIKILMENENVDPSANNNLSLKNALYLRTVKLLLTDKRVDPSINNNFILKKYIANKEFVKELLKDYRVVSKLDKKLRNRLENKNFIPNYKSKRKSWNI